MIAWKNSSAQAGRVASGDRPPKTTTIPGLIQRLQSLSRPRHEFNPSQLDDPLAMKTGWTPAKAGGVLFRTRKLVEIDPDRREFRATTGCFLLVLFVLLTGIVVPIGFIAFGLLSGGLSPFILLPSAQCVAFAIAAGWGFYSGTVPIVFDKRKGFFWKGRQSPGSGP